MTDAELIEFLRHREGARGLFIAGARGPFLEHEAKGLLKELGLSVPKGFYLGVGEPFPAEPAEIDLRYPLVVKVSSRSIASKSDIGGVVLGVNDYEALKEAVSRLMRIKGAEGVLIEEMAPEGPIYAGARGWEPRGWEPRGPLEVIVGGIVDPQFGPALMFGFGGVSVELYRDVAFALTPVAEADAFWLMGQVRGARLLDGFRGRGPFDKEALAEVMIAASRIMETRLVEELDLNPVALYAKGAIVLDAKMKPKGDRW